MFGDTEPAQFPHGIELMQGLPNVPIVIRNYDPDLPIFTGVPRGDETFEGTDFGDTTADATTNQSAPAGVFPGTVLSGSGSVYVVRLDGAAGTQVTVTQVPALLSTEVIPAGTRVLVFQSQSLYFINMASWL